MIKFKDIVGFEDLYMISKDALVVNKKTSKVVNGWVDNGYRRITLCRDSEEMTFKMHRLVAIHFIPNPEGKAYVNHKDCNGLNNSVDNLEWSTASENLQHAYDNNRIKRSRGVNSHMAKVLLHSEMGVFATVAEVAAIESKSFGQMAAIIRGEYPNKTKWILT